MAEHLLAECIESNGLQKCRTSKTFVEVVYYSNTTKYAMEFQKVITEPPKSDDDGNDRNMSYTSIYDEMISPPIINMGEPEHF